MTASYFKSTLFVLFLLAGCAWADEASDRTAIEGIVRAVAAGQGAALFTADADSDLNRLSQLDREQLQLASEPWSETTKPHLIIKSMRFLTPEIAVVEAANVQYGSTILSREVPVLFILKKQGADWRIASLRLLRAR